MPPADRVCETHAERLDELREDVKGIARYIPKIEKVLERSLALQESQKAQSETMKSMFEALHNLTGDLSRIKSEELTGLKIKLSDTDNRLRTLEESKKSVFGIVSPVVTAGIIAALAGLLTLVVTHGIVPK